MSELVITRSDALRPVLVGSHPRSGTHLVMDLLRRQFRSFRSWRPWGMPLDYLYLNLERLEAENRKFSEELGRRIVNRPQRALMKTHFDAAFLSGSAANESIPPKGPWRALAESALPIYIVRHPMDVMASYHQYLSGFNSELAELRLIDFLSSKHWDGSADRLGWWANHAEGWLGRKGVVVLRYEDVIRQTKTIIAKLAISLEEPPVAREPLLPPKITTISRARINRLVSLSPDSTAIVADRLTFPAQDWRKTLTVDNRVCIARRLSPLLRQFGYSMDPSAASVP